MTKLIKVFSVALLLSGAVIADELPPIDEKVTVDFQHTIDSWTKEVPGRVLKWDTTRGAIDWDTLKEEWDAVVFERDDALIDSAKDADLFVGAVDKFDKEHFIVVLKTDKEADIIDWFNV
jgi:hypothetical protein